MLQWEITSYQAGYSFISSLLGGQFSPRISLRAAVNKDWPRTSASLTLFQRRLRFDIWFTPAACTTLLPRLQMPSGLWSAWLTCAWIKLCCPCFLKNFLSKHVEEQATQAPTTCSDDNQWQVGADWCHYWSLLNILQWKYRTIYPQQTKWSSIYDNNAKQSLYFPFPCSSL